MNLMRPEVKVQPRVIFLDAAGTLIRLARPAGATYADVAEQFGARTDAARMEAAFRAVWKEQPHRTPSLTPRENDDRSYWESLAMEALRRGADIPHTFDHAEWFDLLYGIFARPETWQLFDDVDPALARLRGKVRLAVISNFDRRLRTIFRGLGVGETFEELFISSEIGCEKPHAGIFQHAMQAMGVSPDECWHAGDDPERDWAAAEAVGLRSFRLERPGNSLLDLAAQTEEILER